MDNIFFVLIFTISGFHPRTAPRLVWELLALSSCRHHDSVRIALVRRFHFVLYIFGLSC